MILEQGYKAERTFEAILPFEELEAFSYVSLHDDSWY